jgi:hypothetical protein
MSRSLATVLTFVISALAHELVMGCITKKLRGYGFFMMMMQMPIVMVQRSKLLRGRTLLNVSGHHPLFDFSNHFLECAVLVLYDLGVVNGKFHHFDVRFTSNRTFRCARFMCYCNRSKSCSGKIDLVLNQM